MLPKISKRASSIPLSGIRKIAEYTRGLRNGMFLNVGEPDFTTPEHIKETAKKAIEGSLTHYTPIQGIPELREAAAEKLRSKNGIDVETSSEILINAGVQSAFFTTCQALIDKEDETIVQDPFYPTYEVALRLAGAKIVRVRVGLPRLHAWKGYTLKGCILTRLDHSRVFLGKEPRDY